MSLIDVRSPYVHRAGTVLNPEAVEPVWSQGPNGQLLTGYFDPTQGVFQTSARHPLALAAGYLAIPVDAWNAVWHKVARLEFPDHDDNRTLVIDIDQARAAGRQVDTDAGPVVAIPLEACRMWRPPTDAVASQPVVGSLLPAQGPPGIETAVEAVQDVADRPTPSAPPGHQILLDAGPSERGWHHAQTMLRCPQLYSYKYIANVINVTTRSPLIKGALVHIGLAHYYARLQFSQLGRDPDHFYTPSVAIRLLAGRFGPLWQAWVDLAIETVELYMAHRAYDRIRVLAVEEQLRTTIAGHVFTQRADLVVQMPNGKVRIWDHKTTSRLRKDTEKRYALSGQFLGLRHFGPLIWGEDFGGVRVNFLGLTGDNPRYRFRRAPLPAVPHAMACFPQAIVDAEDEIARYKASGRDPFFWPKRLNEQVCNTIYGECEGAPWCTWGRHQPSENPENPS